jgi:hypothetical protein
VPRASKTGSVQELTGRSPLRGDPDAWSPQESKLRMESCSAWKDPHLTVLLGPDTGFLRERTD